MTVTPLITYQIEARFTQARAQWTSPRPRSSPARGLSRFPLVRAAPFARSQRVQIRGRLVPQDPTDERGSVLLEHISATSLMAGMVQPKSKTKGNMSTIMQRIPDWLGGALVAALIGLLSFGGKALLAWRAERRAARAAAIGKLQELSTLLDA